MFKNKGFALPVVLILTAVFIALPIVFWVVISGRLQFNSIKGAATKSEIEQGPYIEVVSKNGSWDLYEYLCTEKTECLQSLSSGKKIAAVSGGVSEKHIVKLNRDTSWDGFKFIKIYAKHGWGSIDRVFKYTSVAGVSTIEQVSIDGQAREVLLMDLSLDKVAKVGVIQD